MTASPVSPIQLRAAYRFQKALGAQLTRLSSAALAESPPKTFLRLLEEADRLALPKAIEPAPPPRARSKLSLFN
jgi:hypothetical protein